MDPNAQSDTVIIALAVLSFLGTVTTAVIAAVVAIMTQRQTKTIDATARAVDGMTHELVTASAGQARAEGQMEGEASQRLRGNPPNADDGTPNVQPVEIVNPEPVPVVNTNPDSPIDNG